MSTADSNRSSAVWFAKAGQVTDAIEHAIRGQDFAGASELLAAHWNEIISSGGLRAVEMWLMSLPEQVVADDARLCLARAWTSFAKGALDEVLPCLKTAEAAPLPGPLLDGTTSVASGAATLRASYWLRTGDYRELLPLVALFALGLLALMDCESDRWNAVAQRLNEARRVIESGGLREYWMTAATELAGGLAAERDGDVARAETSMARSLVLYRRGQAPVETAHALLHLARVHRRQGLDAVARDELEGTRMLVRSCPDPGPRTLRLIARAQGRTPLRAAPPPAGSDELSERELGVLRLLAGELTQREIGSELYLSLNTVKSHTRSIFRKLGVSGRDEAVARARELELI